MAQRAATQSPPCFNFVQMDRTQHLGALASRLSRTLGLARALAQSGRTIDLTGIEDGVGMLCAQILDLSFAEGRQMLPVLHDVLGQVDALRAAMQGPCPATRQSPAKPASAWS